MAEPGLISARRIAGTDAARDIGWTGVDSWTPEHGPVWIHLDREASRAKRWLKESSGINAIAVQALLDPDPRPKVQRFGEALLIVLRGVNLNPGAAPHDMISIRCWIDSHRIITSRHRKVMAIDDIRKRMNNGAGPDRPGEFLVDLARGLTEKAGVVIDQLEEQIDACDVAIDRSNADSTRQTLADTRRSAIKLRRFLAPQRDVVEWVAAHEAPWLIEDDSPSLVQIFHQVTRVVEDLDAVRERAAVSQEELNAQLTESVNRTSYLLTVVAAVFLPLSFLTGLFGANVGGIPLAESSLGFAVVTGGVLALGLAIIAWFKWMKWL